MNNTAALTKSESDFLGHMMRWGSDGYPIRKAGSRWVWEDGFWGVRAPNTTWKTKRKAFMAVERYISLLIDRKAGRA